MADTERIKDWYDERYRRDRFATMRPFVAYLAFLDVLMPRPPGRLLDVACGTGFFLQAAADRGLGVYGIDLSDEAVALASHAVPSATLHVGPAEKLPFSDGQMDYVSCLGSLEHFVDPDAALEEMKRVATASARFLFVVPNAKFIGWFALGRPGTEQQVIVEELRSRRAWEQLFAKHGFAVERIEKDRWYLKRSIHSRSDLAGLVSRWLHRLAWRLVPLELTYQFVYVLRKV